MDGKEPNADVSHQDSVQEQPGEDDRFEQVERDSNGNIIMTVKKDPDGNLITAYYDAYPNAKEILVEFASGGVEHSFYGPDGMLERLISSDAQGPTTERFYKNNVLTQEIINGGEEERFYENGILRREIQKFENVHIERLYYPQGTPESVVKTESTLKTTETYHTDGWLQSKRTENVEGFYEVVYQADGVLLSEEFGATGVKYIYDMAGNKVEAYDIDNYGRRTHIFWLADRTAIIYCHEADGTVTKTVQAPNNGSILSEIKNYTGEETAEIGTIVVPNANHP